MIGSENSRHFLYQLDANLSPIATWHPSFAALLIHAVFFVLDFDSDWFLVIFSSP